VPTLDELRKMLAEGVGETKRRDIREGKADWGVDGALADHLDNFEPPEAPPPPGGRGIDPKRMSASKAKAGALPDADRPPRHTISADGTDATIHFGKFKDLPLSVIAAREPDYLAWMIKEFGTRTDKATRGLIDVVRYRIRALRGPGARKPMPKLSPGPDRWRDRVRALGIDAVIDVDGKITGRTHTMTIVDDPLPAPPVSSPVCAACEGTGLVSSMDDRVTCITCGGYGRSPKIEDDDE
jgi:hypothetical protein